MADPQRTAVIDLGSNTFRLVVFSAGKGWWRRSDEIYEPVRIGEHIGEDGKLGRPQMERALNTIDVFAHFCRATKIPPDRVRAVATSAIRDATNREKFVAAAQKRSGLEIDVLSREDEARFGYLAAVNSTTLRDGAVLDLGGGSMQLVRTRERRADKLASWPLGAVRMTERFGDDLDALRDHVAAELADGAGWLPKAGRRLVGIGGTVRNLAAATQGAAGLPSMGVQGFPIPAAALDELVERLAALSPAERGKVRGIKPGRADVILAGAVVIQTVLREGGFDALEVTEAGLREGVFFAEHLDGDPPLFDDVRRESVLNLAAQYQVDPAHTAHVAALALGIFDSLAADGVFTGDPIERQLLWAACMLHDIGMRVDYDDHHKHSRYLILNAGLPGYSPIEVALIAQAARYHRKGMSELGAFAKLAGPGDDRRLDRLAVLLRLGEDLERSRDQSVTAARVATRNGGAVHLTLEADEGIEVARWAAERETELFERAFGRTLRIEA
ncbi:Ppx/GppA family phosphatase [Svornostia abyssi]|uniref:Ppx/GppA family phosphatase n=1 Tax=Svornostia abyssi TaxID=2898438 RepID=A0ABY5PL82_9ACTN|nr:Ppx/GppA family phosphatase [Parviterribacteraceae bacterium J379]